MDAAPLLDYAGAMKAKQFPVTIERMRHSGAGEGTHEGVSVQVFGMFTGERGIVSAHKRHGIWIGTPIEIIGPDPRRRASDEAHHLSCSPWQSAEYALQAALKKNVLEELYGYYPDVPAIEFEESGDEWGYRTKIEFSFCDRDESGNPAPLAPAFHIRGGGRERIRLPDGCHLASQAMNSAALSITERLRAQGFSARDLKTLVLRESKATGRLLALLFAQRADIPRFSVDDIRGLSGFIAFHSTEKSPASVPTKELWRWGEGFLDETVLGMHIRYSPDSFFQNNIPMFEKVVRRLLSVTQSKGTILELYSGVGTIGLLLANDAMSVRGIEAVESAVAFAKANARHNGIMNYVAERVPAEKIDARLLNGTDTLVVDPPRAGLHPKVIETILMKPPPQISYLSCNPETQARDYSIFSERYRIVSVTGYDFYPQTPHLESLLVLERKN